MKKLGVIFFMFVISISFARAFSVSTIYSEGYPLTLAPGEEKETFFLLQNFFEGDGDLNVFVQLYQGQEIAKFSDSSLEYSLPFGKAEEVSVLVKAPENAEPGKRYLVGVLFKPVPEDFGEGDVQFLVNVGKSIPVLIVGEDYEDPLEKKRLQASFTLEDETLNLGGLAPSSGNARGIWFFVIFFFVLVILILGVLILFFVFRRRPQQIVVVPVQGSWPPGQGSFSS